MPRSPEHPQQLADIKEPEEAKKASGFEIARTPESKSFIDVADNLAGQIERDENVTAGQVLELEQALDRLIESDPRLEAKRLFGESYMGPDEIEQHFTLESGEKLFEYTVEEKQRISQMLREKLDDPQIRDLIKRTSREELRDRFQLFLFPDKFKDGTPVTMKSLQERFEPEMMRRGLDKLLKDTSWYENEDFFTSDSNPLSWKLLSRGNIEGSTNKNYIEETRFFREYLRQNNLATTDELNECSDAKLEELNQLMSTDLKEAAKQLSELKINQKYRINPLEVIFIHATSKSALAGAYARTAKRSSGGELVGAGHCGDDGANLHWWPGGAVSDLGVSFSR